MVQYNLIVLFAAFYGAYGAGYEFHDFVSTGICQTRRNILLEPFWSQPKEIRILSDAQRGIIYDQSWNSSSFKRYSKCKFTLKTPPGAGLYLIVRKLNLRRDSKGNCIDTVSVKQSNNKETSFCYTPTDVPRSFSDNSHMKITIKLENSIPLPTVEDMLHVQLIATPKVYCISGANRLRCEPHDAESCIDESFSRDGTINCPSCVDEGRCSSELETVYVADKQSIALTAFVSLLFTMMVCCCCIWCLYKNRRCITSCSNHGGGGAATDNGIRFRGRRTAQSSGILSVELPGSSHDHRPTAPKLDEKDLPPSYDALFPTAPDASAASGPTTVSTATSPTIPSTEVGRELDSTK